MREIESARASGPHESGSQRLIALGRNPANAAPEMQTRWHPIAWKALGLIFLTFVVFGGWSAIARLDSAAVASGVVATSGNLRTVQHLEGGIVSEIHVKNGDHVNAGDLLIKMDTTQTEASVNLFKRQLAAGRARAARLTAEQALAASFELPDTVLPLSYDRMVASAMEDERATFRVRRNTLLQQQKIIGVESDQIREEIAVLEEQKAAAEAEAREISSMATQWAR